MASGARQSFQRRYAMNRAAVAINQVFQRAREDAPASSMKPLLD
jgi:hypothetical protein